MMVFFRVSALVMVNVLAFWREVLPPSSLPYLKGCGSEMEEKFCQL
jgi:hypothetical protein